MRFRELQKYGMKTFGFHIINDVEFSSSADEVLAETVNTPFNSLRKKALSVEYEYYVHYDTDE